ncbi:MAG: octanoyltransferase [Deltaproteobacteria bacterium]|jgi:lipoyl(octanoyl) transferase|nr:MAG: octanoyltransferase [Deltaproteobacteria bacterium]
MAVSLENIIRWEYKERVDYLVSLNTQRKLHREVVLGDFNGRGFLLLVEHTPVITVGRFGNQGNILASKEEIEKKGVRVYRIERGGDVTYHGPGQLVGYPIINLRDFGLGVKTYVYLLEKTIMDALKDFGIEGYIVEEYPGVWVGDEKIAAIGIYVRNWVTMHGFALNVNTDLEHFSFIVPCGIPDKGVTSMKKILGKEIPLRDVALSLIKWFEKNFRAKLVPSGVSLLTEFR